MFVPFLLDPESILDLDEHGSILCVLYMVVSLPSCLMFFCDWNRSWSTMERLILLTISNHNYYHGNTTKRLKVDESGIRLRICANIIHWNCQVTTVKKSVRLISPDNDNLPCTRTYRAPAFMFAGIDSIKLKGACHRDLRTTTFWKSCHGRRVARRLPS